jgi:hypothetical protein
VANRTGPTRDELIRAFLSADVVRTEDLSWDTPVLAEAERMADAALTVVAAPADDTATLRANVEHIAAWCRGIARKAVGQDMPDLAITAPVIAEEIDRALAGHPLAYARPAPTDPDVAELLVWLRERGKLPADDTAARPERAALDRIGEIVGWPPGTDPDTIVAYVAKRDGARALVHETVRRRERWLREALRAPEGTRYPELLRMVRPADDTAAPAARQLTADDVASAIREWNFTPTDLPRDAFLAERLNAAAARPVRDTDGGAPS